MTNAIETKEQAQQHVKGWGGYRYLQPGDGEAITRALSIARLAEDADTVAFLEGIQ